MSRRQLLLNPGPVTLSPGVRQALLPLQRELGHEVAGVVAEGRDLGTVVFPHAHTKLFLTASVEVRAKRRYDELKERGEQVSLEQTMEEVRKRDQADQERPIAPLKQAEDAVLVDCTQLSVEQVVESMRRVIQHVET